MKNYLLTGIIFLLSICTVQVAAAQDNTDTVATTNTGKSSLTESQKIEELINCVRNLKGAAFIRNGSEHSPEQAAEHLASKWKKHSAKIRTAEEFVQHLATKSSATGEVYMIRLSDGNKVPTADVLYKRLMQLSATAKE